MKIQKQDQNIYFTLNLLKLYQIITIKAIEIAFKLLTNWIIEIIKPLDTNIASRGIGTTSANFFLEY